MIALACDHGGYTLKETVKKPLLEQGYEVRDFGTNSLDSCDYPDYGAPAARAVASGECDRGILICTTGIGMSIAANKIRGIRCAHCSDVYSAEKSREHNDANMIALGGRVVGQGLAEKIVDAFLDTEFLGGRHADRVQMMMELENP